MIATQSTRTDIERDIRETLGIVPGFFKGIPAGVLKHEWPLFNHFELGETHIPLKYKQLLALAVHAETKCRYCTLFHTELARLFGANDDKVTLGTSSFSLIEWRLAQRHDMSWFGKEHRLIPFGLIIPGNGTMSLSTMPEKRRELAIAHRCPWLAGEYRCEA